jgi:putative protein-disulfide isomerase
MLQLRETLPQEIQWINVLGGLAPDTDQPMPEQTRQMVQTHWRKIQATVGTEFNFDFWDKCAPRRDTYKACRAVIAAARQGAEEVMIEAIQRAYYLRAMNPSEPETLFELAEELVLDGPQFVRDFEFTDVELELQRQFQLRRDLQVRSFPSLVLKNASAYKRIQHDYGDYRVMLNQILVDNPDLALAIGEKVSG